MEELVISPYLLAGLFLGITVIYASVGLGGGTAYTALLAIFGATHETIPTVSLTLNVIVTSLGSFAFIQQGYGRFRLIVPFLLTSIPASYLGGTLDLSPTLFYWILLVTLTVVAARIYLWDNTQIISGLNSKQEVTLSLITGTILGLIAGIVGIGGGIYLVPLIIMLGLGTEHEAAACGAVFTLINSASGLLARVQHFEIDWTATIPAIAAVTLGSIFGSYLGTHKISPQMLQKVLGVIIIVAIILLISRLLSG
jgi:uncharacterized membrane protein YfcA